MCTFSPNIYHKVPGVRASRTFPPSAHTPKTTRCLVARQHPSQQSAAGATGGNPRHTALAVFTFRKNCDSYLPYVHKSPGCIPIKLHAIAHLSVSHSLSSTLSLFYSPGPFAICILLSHLSLTSHLQFQTSRPLLLIFFFDSVFSSRPSDWKRIGIEKNITTFDCFKQNQTSTTHLLHLHLPLHLLSHLITKHHNHPLCSHSRLD